MGMHWKYLSQLGSFQALFAVCPQARRDAGGTLPCAAADRRCGGEDEPPAPGAVPGQVHGDDGDSGAAQVSAVSLRAASPPLLLQAGTREAGSAAYALTPSPVFLFACCCTSSVMLVIILLLIAHMILIEFRWAMVRGCYRAALEEPVEIWAGVLALAVTNGQCKEQAGSCKQTLPVAKRPSSSSAVLMSSESWNMALRIT